MNKTIILVVITSLVAGFLGVHTVNSTLPQLTESVTGMIQPLISMVQPAITQAQTMWALIPESIQGYILPGVIGAVMGTYGLFMTWTKLRVMKSAEQAKVQATASFSQLKGETTSQITQLQTDKKILAEQLSKVPQTDPQLVADLQKQQGFATHYKTELNKAENTIATLQGIITDLKLKEKVVYQ